MVEIFKTNVSNCSDAQKLIEQIHQNFPDYTANFDLEDCDLILRVQPKNESVMVESIICLLKENGFCAKLIEDQLATDAAILYKS